MDAQTNAEKQVELARKFLQSVDALEVGEPLHPGDVDDAAELAELVIALAEWRARDGFAPDWRKALGAS